MKKSYFFSALFIITIITIVTCKKDYHLNIVLHDKPLTTIRQYIHGTWKLVYSRIESGRYPCNNCSVEFTEDDKFISNTLTVYVTPYVITWIKDIGMFLNGDSTYLMTIGHEFGYSQSFIIDKIVNDTLIFYENFETPFVYYCIKSNNKLSQ
jgi:hypothetical protein